MWTEATIPPPRASFPTSLPPPVLPVPPALPAASGAGWVLVAGRQATPVSTAIARAITPALPKPPKPRSEKTSRSRRAPRALRQYVVLVRHSPIDVRLSLRAATLLHVIVRGCLVKNWLCGQETDRLERWPNARATGAICAQIEGDCMQMERRLANPRVHGQLLDPLVALPRPLFRAVSVRQIQSLQEVAAVSCRLCRCGIDRAMWPAGVLPPWT